MYLRNSYIIYEIISVKLRVLISFVLKYQHDIVYRHFKTLSNEVEWTILTNETVSRVVVLKSAKSIFRYMFAIKTTSSIAKLFCCFK